MTVRERGPTSSTPEPVLIEWGGFIHRGADALIVDPDSMFLPKTGYQSLYVGDDLGNGVEAWARKGLTGMTHDKKFQLRSGSRHARGKATEQLLENEWIRAALAAGPVDPIPLPRHLSAVQQSLI